MDSANSGSLQSSSGGEDEYDSRAATFITGPPISTSPNPFLDPLSSYLFNSTPTWPRPGPNPLIAHDNGLPSSSSFMPSFQPGVENSSCAAVAPNQNPSLNQNPNRNPKKRSRASRRAPTTVLTTDTSNFRAMVQEFTGIPAPPFSNSSFPRSRIDFFGGAAVPPPYLRRPFPQKVQPLDAITASSPISNHLTSNLSPPTTASAAAAPPPSGSNPSINYQLPITQNSNLFNNIQNPLLSSLLQSNPKFPFSTPPSIPSNINDETLFPVRRKDRLTGVFMNIDHQQTEQFSSNQGNHLSETLTGLPNLIPSDQNAARWNDNRDGRKDDVANVRSLNGTYSFQASSTAKTPESVVARGEGMVESWICSSE